MSIKLCAATDIPEGGSKGFELADGATPISLFAVKRKGEVYVYQNSCPHLGIELNWQEDQFLDFQGVLIQCSTHGALFEIDSGYCIAGPCAGQSLAAIPCRQQEGHVYIDLRNSA